MSNWKRSNPISGRTQWTKTFGTTTYVVNSDRNSYTGRTSAEVQRHLYGQHHYLNLCPVYMTKTAADAKRWVESYEAEREADRWG